MRKQIIFLVIIFSIVAFLESSIPYYYAEKKCNKENVFLGQIISTFDQNMYFSFIRQARNGYFLFNNRLTYVSNPRVFVNLEFWLIGKLQGVTGISENAVYNLWRCIGIVALVTSFILLAELVLVKFWKIVFATFLFLFAGGIGFIHVAMNKLGFLNSGDSNIAIFGNNAQPSLAMDASTYLLPVNQMMTNPHFSLPAGLDILCYFFYLYAEKKGKNVFYLFSGVIAVLVALIRPYDILPVLCVFPVYYIITNGLKKIRLKDLFIKLLPLWMVIPPLIYNIWLFRYNEIFKYWSLQGNTSDVIPSFFVHYLNFGIIGILALFRIVVLYRRDPLSKNEVFLFVLAIVTLLVNHAGKYFNIISWSFQVGVYLAAPIVLLGCSIDRTRLKISKKLSVAVTASIIGIAVISNLTLVIWHCKILSDPANSTRMYASRYEYDSWQWLQQHSKQGEVLLSSTYSSSRIAKYTDLSVVVGHPFVTPEYKNVKEMSQNIVFDTVIGANHKNELSKLNVDYIYIGPIERLSTQSKVENTNYISEVYHNPLVSIYKINRQ